MTHPERPSPPERPPRKPDGDLLLAQALDACLSAEQAEPGSSAAIIARQPAWARGDLRAMVALAHSLEASAAGVGPSAEFTTAARERLLQRSAGEATVLGGPHLTAVEGLSRVRGRRRWKLLARGSVGLFAAVMALGATLSASASSLPGDPLYTVKQAQEELNLRLATDDQARVLALLRRADARLDETSRLLQQGRTSEAVEVAQRFDQSVERATTAFVVTVDRHDDPERYEHLQSALGEQQQRLETIIQSAPEPARPDLREALTTTERGRELMADPRPVERALGLRQRPQAAAAAPTSHAEEEPTAVPTATSVPPTPVPPTATPVVVVASRAAHSNDDDERDRDREDDRPAVAITRPSNNSNGNTGRGNASRQQQAPTSSSSSDDGAHDELEEHDASSPTQVAFKPPAAVQRSSDDDHGDHDSSGPEERPTVARPTEVRLTEPPLAPEVEARTGSDRGESNTSTRSTTRTSGSGSKREVAPPPPTPTTPPATSVRSSEADDRASTVTLDAARSTPTLTATPTPKRTADARQGTSGGTNRSGVDTRSGSGSDSGDRRDSGDGDD